MSDDTRDMQAVINTAIEACSPEPLAGTIPLYSVVIPEGATHEVIDTEALLSPYHDQPARQKGTVYLSNPASLAAYVNDTKVPATKLWADWRARKATAVLNDHQGTEAGWGDHRAVLSLVATPEWSAWEANNAKWMSQEDFAEHILATSADVVSPDTADLLEMAETFQATKSVAFKSGNRLRDGQRQLTYVETIDAQAGPAGNVTIPDAILLKLAPFDGAEPVEMTARIRYRINDGNLKIGYVLDRPDLVLREAFSLVMVGVQAETELTPLWGTPRS